MAWNVLHSEALNLSGSVFTECLVSPQVLNLNELILTCNNAKVFKTELEILLGSHAPVDNSRDSVTTADFRGINLRHPPEPVPCAAAKIACSLLSLGVLIDSNQILVLQDIDGVLRGNRKIAANDQWSFSDGPESKVSLLFLMREPTVANLKHVRVIPASWTTALKMLLTFLEVVFNRGEVIKDVLSGSKAIADIRGPAPRLFLAPVAQGVKDIAASRGKGLTHGLVSDSTSYSIVVAIVVLEVVDAPAGPVLRIILLVVETSGAASTGHRSST